MRLENKQHKTCKSVFETARIFSALPSTNGFYINGKKKYFVKGGEGGSTKTTGVFVNSRNIKPSLLKSCTGDTNLFLLYIKLNTDTLPVMQLEHRHHRLHCCQKDRSPVQQKHEVVEILLELFLTWAVLYPSITHVVM